MLFRGKIFLVFNLLVILSACGQTPTQDLQSYVDEVKSRKFKMDDTNIHMVAYRSYAYVGDKLRDPFAAKVVDPINDPIDCTPPNHISGVLEKYPLDTLSFVGNIQHSGNNLWALVRSKDGTVHRIKANDYIGQNNGRISKITVDSIELDELVRQVDGGCIKRHTILSLSE